MNKNLILGALLSLAGAACIVYPLFASAFVESVLGVGFMIGAAASFIKLFSTRGVWSWLFILVVTCLYIFATWVMFKNPVEFIDTIANVIGALFVIEGILILVFWRRRPGDFSNSSVMLINGFLALVLGIFALANSYAGIWFVGVLVGVDLLFSGFAVMSSGCICANKSCPTKK